MEELYTVITDLIREGSSLQPVTLGTLELIIRRALARKVEEQLEGERLEQRLSDMLEANRH